MKMFALIIMTFAGIAGVFVLAGNPSKDDTKQLRNQLSTILAIEEDEKFLFAYWGFMRENGIDVLFKKGDRVSLWKSLLVLKSDGKFDIRAANNESITVETLCHFILEDGRWVQSEERPTGARSYVMSTANTVFVIDLNSERVSILKR